VVRPPNRPALSRRRFLAAACVVCAPVGIAAVTVTEPLPTRFDPARDPVRDLEMALNMARATGRRVLVSVGGEWCTWCHVMDRFFAGNTDLRKIRDASFIVLKVNFSRENQNQAFLGRWPAVAGYPHFYVLGADGRLLHSQDTSALEAGNEYDPIAFRAFLVEWSPR
jgi:thiol:disulfide interchange protein